MIVIYGDSNYRNMLELHKEQLKTSLEEEIVFKMVTSNESLKTQLETLVTPAPKIIIFGTHLNEVVRTVSVNKNKGRDETIRSVIEETNRIVHASAKVRTETVHIVVPPFFRLEPQWISTRIRLGVFYVKDHMNSGSPWNVVVGSQLEATASDLVDDKVHLNVVGKEKLYKTLEKDLKNCLEQLKTGQKSLDWAMEEGSEPATPITLRKRRRQASMPSEDEEEEGEGQGRKKAKLDTMLDKIDVLVKTIQQERSDTKVELQNLATKLVEHNATVEAVKETVEGLKSGQKADLNLTAEMREDIDGLENENLKTTVIIRKLKAAADSPVPSDKKLLRSYIQTLARKIVGEIIGQDAVIGVKYAAQLYSFIDPTKKDNREGLVPPFKIGFATKDMAVKFREAAIKLAKEVGSQYKDTYFSFFQSSGTRVRLVLMWSIADALKTDQNEVWINQNQAKPTLQMKENGKITKTMSFVKAVTEYKEKIPQKTIEEATKLAKRTFAGNLEKTFLVLKD
jgi:hypothetical protein